MMSDEEFTKMEMGILEDLSSLQPEEIEELKAKWFQEQEAELTKHPSVKEYIDVLCEVAIDRAKGRLGVAV